MEKKPIIEVIDCNKYYGSNHVVKNLNLTVYEGEFLTILGSSGCGKTTTLRMIAGFEDVSSGKILIQGEPLDEKEAYERDVNTVFQNYALFPHMTIFENIAYGLKMKKVPKHEIKTQVMKMLELVQLHGFEDRKPSQLSGGQKQRVAIARALINKPKVLLLDEPLGALDLKLRKQMQFELKRLQQKLKLTFIYVTHDQEEAMTMSDRIAVMNNGVLQQLAKPVDIYMRPKTKFVAEFIGATNVFDGVIDYDKTGKKRMLTEYGHGEIGDTSYSLGTLLNAFVRPEYMKYSREKRANFELKGVLKDSFFVGQYTKLVFEMTNYKEIIVIKMGYVDDLEIGAKVYLYWEPENLWTIVSKEQELYNTALDTMEFLKNNIEKK